MNERLILNPAYCLLHSHIADPTHRLVDARTLHVSPICWHDYDFAAKQPTRRELKMPMWLCDAAAGKWMAITDSLCLLRELYSTFVKYTFRTLFNFIQLLYAQMSYKKLRLLIDREFYERLSNDYVACLTDPISKATEQQGSEFVSKDKTWMS